MEGILRKRIAEARACHDTSTAVFLSDKLVTLTGGNENDLALYATCLFNSQQYEAAYGILESNKLVHENNSECMLLAAVCLVELRRFTLCISTFESILNETAADPQLEKKDVVTKSSLHNKMADAYANLDKRALAAESCKRALVLDPFNYNAFSKLSDYSWIKSYDLIRFLEEVTFPKEAHAIKSIYTAKVVSQLVEIDMDTIPAQMRENLDVVLYRAIGLFSTYNLSQCYKITKSVLDRYPHRVAFIPLHLCCAFHMQNSEDIFFWAHQLMEMNPHSYLARFAVGCYYYTLCDYENAKKFFSQSTTQNMNFQPAWIGVANSFVVESPEPALVAYRLACKLFPGSHYPYLYIGMEYMHKQKFGFALEFLQSALDRNMTDPTVHNELGVLKYQQGEYEEAEKNFRNGLELCKRGYIWINVYIRNNLGQLLRKMKRFEEAIKEFNGILQYTRDAQIYASLGFCHQYLGRYSLAVTLYHKALNLDKDYSFAKRMLRLAIEEDVRTIQLVKEGTNMLDISNKKVF